MNVLVTGFAAGPSHSNASEILIRSLREALPPALQPFSANLHFEILDTDTHGLQTALHVLLQKIQPRICVFTGQAPGRNKIALESTARNLRNIGPPLKEGEAPQRALIRNEGPAERLATLPDLDRLLAGLLAAQIPAAVSHDAGSSLCNQLLYEGLAYAVDHGNVPLCGFVHIPALPQQVIQHWPDYPSMCLPMLRDAISVILCALMPRPEAWYIT